MKKLTYNQMSEIIGGALANPIDDSASCSVKCAATGEIGTHNCGSGVMCVADTARESVWCGTVENCVC
jgi:bacteriocin-like protein